MAVRALGSTGTRRTGLLTLTKSCDTNRRDSRDGG